MTRTCVECGVEKVTTRFFGNQDSCKKCTNARKRGRPRETGPEADRREAQSVDRLEASVLERRRQVMESFRVERREIEVGGRCHTVDVKVYDALMGPGGLYVPGNRLELSPRKYCSPKELKDSPVRAKRGRGKPSRT